MDDTLTANDVLDYVLLVRALGELVASPVPTEHFIVVHPYWLTDEAWIEKKRPATHGPRIRFRGRKAHPPWRMRRKSTANPAGTKIAREIRRGFACGRKLILSSEAPVAPDENDRYVSINGKGYWGRYAE